MLWILQHFRTVGAILFASAVLLTDGSTNTTTYVVALLGQDIQTAINNDLEYELVMTNTAEKDITVEITGIAGMMKSVSVQTGKAEKVSLNSLMAMNGSEYANKSLIMNSTDSFVLQVFTIRRDFKHVEGFLAVSIEDLVEVSNGTFEYLVTTFCATGGFCQLAVASINDQTPIYIKLPETVDEIAICKHKTYFRTGRDKYITLNKFDVLQLETTFDLTGTHIYSYQPIVVFAGSRNVTNGNQTAHTVEQLVPDSFWGDEYVVHNLANNGYGDILKIASVWSETKIKMSGYPPFAITDNYHTVVRRLDSGTRTHIMATHPIQVIQISGLTYATTNETSSLSMTVVPSVQNAWKNFNVSCYSSSNNATFHIVSGKEVTTKIEGNIVISKDNIYYTKYQISKPFVVTNSSVMSVTGTETIGGILKCGNTVTMPLGIKFNREEYRPPTYEPIYKGGTCYEGGRASTKFDYNTGITAPSTLNLTDLPDYVLKLRVRACGEAVLQFYTDADIFKNSLIVTITNKVVVMKKCFPNCTQQNSKQIPNNGSKDVADWDCKVDMSFIWFRQINDSGTLRFCLGTGLRSSACDDTRQDPFYNISSRFVKVTMMGLFADADFHWGRDHPEGCTSYEADWRCMDKWKNCSAYGTQFCNETITDGFARTYCAKYCGKCFADSYGNKFLVRLPALAISYCKIIVSPLNLPTHVTVFYEKSNKNTVVHGATSDGVRSYDCESGFKGIGYTIIADREVSVVVVYGTSLQNLASFRVFPVDTFGLEHMVLSYNNYQPTKVPEDCFFMSEYDDIHMTPYHLIPDRNIQTITTYKLSGKTYIISKQDDLLVRTPDLNDIAGTMFVFDKPSTVFCGMKTDGKFYNQIPTTNTWSKDYVIPAFESEPINRPFDAKLKIIAYTDNTIVKISGGFDAVHALYYRGDTVIQEIDPSTTYFVHATEKIAVGLYLYDPSNSTKSSFHILPSFENMHDTIVTSVPNMILGNESVKIKTYFVNDQRDATTIEKPSTDVSMFYRHVSLKDAKWGLTVVQTGLADWFVVPSNAKAKVLIQERSECNTSRGSLGDGKDNDCDGLTDEDVCSGKYGVYVDDHDLGGFGDDCSRNIYEPNIVSKPQVPSCLDLSSKPKDQCWTVCSCKCSDVEKYQAEKNLTREELEEAYAEKNKEMQSKLKLDSAKLTSTKIGKESARDKRQSAANIGYVGVGLFVLVFSAIIILDASALYRDAKKLAGNLKDGFKTLCDCFRRNDS